MTIRKSFKILEKDPWLLPSAAEIEERYNRYLNRLEMINSEAGDILSFARSYLYYGIHYDEKREGWFYREWAPRAKQLYLTGDFNNWNRSSHPMTRKENGNWELFLEKEMYKDTFTSGSMIKVVVETDNNTRDRIPAYITRVFQDDETKDFKGQLWFPEPFNWSDDDFNISEPGELLIYECHIGMAQEKEGIGNYKEFIENNLPRIKELGYNAIQLMAIQEHPYYGSFGYHVSNFFAPSFRYGSPDDLKLLIKTAHREGIAVILDIVHSHTVKNINEGLNEFDGYEGLYFHTGSRSIHPQWDSMLFDYGKKEVLRFLLSNLLYWLHEFHFDGFRFDGVGSMMYFHHGLDRINRREKYFTEGVEYDAVTYLQLANNLVHQYDGKKITIAEDVTGMPGLAHPVEEGGLGFDYRLGMGIPDFWIKILKDQKDEEWNIHEIWHVLNDRLPDVKTVAYCESHDQALVGDKTIAFRLMDKEMYDHMSVNDDNFIIDRGIALHKMIRLFTISLGGQAYMNFMGNEFGHPEWIDFPREGNNWSYKYARRQWSLVDKDYLKYKYLAAFDKAMIKMVKDHHILHSDFARQLNMDEHNKTIVFERNNLVFIFNWHTSHSIPDYEFRMPRMGKYRIILNSDSHEFGGHERIDESLDYIAVRNNIGQITAKIYNINRSAMVLKRIV